MTYQDFYKSFMGIKETNPSYRLGQHFMNLFIKDESDPILYGLYEKTGDEAYTQIFEVINAYNWDVRDLPLMEKGKDHKVIVRHQNLKRTTHEHYRITHKI